MRVALVVCMFCANVAVWAQPQMQNPETYVSLPMPSVLYLEKDAASGMTVFKLAAQELGLWKSHEIARAPYLDVLYAGRGGAVIAGGESIDACHFFGMDLLNGRMLGLQIDPMPNPWVGKKHSGWVRLEPNTQTIHFAYLNKDGSAIIAKRYSYNVNETDQKELGASLFADGISQDMRLAMSPDLQHLAYLTKPKALAETPGLFESTLKIIHYTNMSVTDATKSVKTVASGGAESAWAPFAFQDNSHVHYFTAETGGETGAHQVKYLYKAVEIEQGTNSEFFATVLPSPKSGGYLYREPVDYKMIFEYDGETPVDFFIDFSQSRSMIPYPRQDKYTMEQAEGTATIKVGRKTLYTFAGATAKLLGGIKSQYGNYVFSLVKDEAGNTGSDVYLYDTAGALSPVLWSSNPVEVVGVLEISEPVAITP